MNYGNLDRQQGTHPDKLISDLELDLYQVSEEEVKEALEEVDGGAAILDLLQGKKPPTYGTLGEDEFGAPEVTLNRPSSQTWTLVVLSDLKPIGREIKRGVLQRMLAAALPLGSEMVIRLNGEQIVSSKIGFPTTAEWKIGPDLGIDSIDLKEEEDLSTEDMSSEISDDLDDSGSSRTKVTKTPVTCGTDPVPYVCLPEIGRVTGLVRLFHDRISVGKSEERGASNGFHINVLGRVVNQNDPSFGEENLSHAVWSRFRMAVRADGLNNLLTTNREQFSERRELQIFRAFLRKVFNKARTLYDSDDSAKLQDGGDVLVSSLGVLSLNPLRNVVSETLKSQSPLPELFDETGIKNREEYRRSWQQNTADNIKNALNEVKYEQVDGNSFVRFRIADNTVVINKDHPFVAEHSRTKAEKELLRNVAMVHLLTDVYAVDIGVQQEMLEGIRKYRDDLMRFSALQRRESGTYIASLLLKTQHDSRNSRRFEKVISDALRYLDFEVLDLAQSGQPEGIASAYPLPTFSSPTQNEPHPPLYSFSFDAKSSKRNSAQTGNIDLAAVVEHRNRYEADYVLVVAPGFAGDAITTRCTQQKVTPLAARDLGRLLEYTVKYGAIPVTKLREIFSLYNHKKVAEWVENLEGWLREQRPLTLNIFLKALENLKGKVPDVLPAATLALECRENLNAVSVKNDDVIAITRGLSILIPDLVGIDGDKIVINASARHVADAVKSQLEALLDEEPSRPTSNGGQS